MLQTEPGRLDCAVFFVVLLLTKNARHHAQNYSHCDKRPVPLVISSHCGNPKEDEDEGLAHAAQHLQEILDGGVRLVRYVGLHVGPHHGTARYQSGQEIESNPDWLQLSNCSGKIYRLSYIEVIIICLDEVCYHTEIT